MKTQESKNYARPSAAVPMPKLPITGSPPSAVPMPSRMPDAESPFAETAANTRSPDAAHARVIAMSDYPSGRGGMHSVAVPSAPQAEQKAERADMSIGPRPPASPMPT